MKIITSNGEIKIFAETIEAGAIAQVVRMAESPLGDNAHIRIMPDAHSGVGCVIGTTMQITDKVCPNLVGVDIGCGVLLAWTDIRLTDMSGFLDAAIRATIPSGMVSHDHVVPYPELKRMRCWDKLSERAQELSQRSLGTLGGGNHFIEAYEDGAIAVHSGSRNIGNVVARYYQQLAIKRSAERAAGGDMKQQLEAIPPKERSKFIEKMKAGEKTIADDLAYLTGSDMVDYLHDVSILQQFAADNRAAILNTIMEYMGLKAQSTIESVHNYISSHGGWVLRKGAISAEKGEYILIPLNMRDGMLICEGLGNEDWNNSAPHGAGRLYSRTAAKKMFTVEQYAAAMAAGGVYTTCVNEGTLDEAPFAYKDELEIKEAINPTARVVRHLKPMYNFKAGADDGR